ncbi:hypothetical protein Tco_0801733 [Tanacetum coccineum]|uniref:Uncharacterized protein n=1 Tax=Tanacetum coccineum TaxID=301880 RepID=A0ABQ5A0T4_9ASTR
MVLGIASAAIIDRQLPFEYTITSRSTDVVVVDGPRFLFIELSDDDSPDTYASYSDVFCDFTFLHQGIEPLATYTGLDLELALELAF